MEDLTDKVAVITGAASGIGLGLAERFLDEGMRVVLADIDEPRLREVEARLSESGATVHAHVCDTASEAAVDELAEATLQRFGAAHILCNNAGIAGMGDPWSDPIALWERVFAINVYGVIHGIRSFLPIMESQGEGHVVNTASMAGLVPVPGAAPYAASKHAVVGISESLYLELEALGSPVGVSVLCPAFVKTRLMEHEPPAAVGDDAGAMKMSDLMNGFLRAGVESGIEVDDVTEQVVDAIKTRRFWILTHPDARSTALERIERAVAQQNPPPLGS
jgi:NAD(P)-dependent dehydrogenase (short-subunit alcohol dehydrogenase family)